MESIKLKGYVTRDNTEGAVPELLLHTSPPRRGKERWTFGFVTGGIIELPEDSFPEVTWSTDPVEVEVTINVK